MSELEFAFGGVWRPHGKHVAYWFSDAGLCARVVSRKGRLSITLLSGCASGRGYRAISCPVGGGKYERVYIHRAVCELFNGASPFDGAQVRHLDCDMRNNAAENLAWGTPSQNAMDGVANGKILKGHASPCARLTQEQASDLRSLRKAGLSYKDLGNQFGVARMTAQRLCTQEQWQ